MTHTKTITYLAVGTIVLITVGILLIWTIDTRRDTSVISGVMLAGESISNYDQTQLDKKVTSLANAYEEETLSIEINGENYKNAFSIPAQSIDLKIDKNKTVDTALNTGRDGNVFGQIKLWIQSRLFHIQTPIFFTTDEAKLAELTTFLDPTPTVKPIEPSITLQDNKLEAIEGQSGFGISDQTILDTLPDALNKGLPLKLIMSPQPLKPQHSNNDIEKLINDIERAASSPLKVKIENESEIKEISPETIRSWVKIVYGKKLTYGLNDEKVKDDLKELFSNTGTKPKDAVWVIEDETPKLVGDQPGEECCDTTSVSKVLTALKMRSNGRTSDDDESLELNLRLTPPTLSHINTPQGDIKSKIGEFTTHHPPGQPRVHNIHRMADIVKGSLIKPGETFSLNDHVGPRTASKGFAVDGVIENGRFTKGVGGGVSQFATTAFNAAFFSGLDFGEYQAHGIYIDRYPHGREATISHPHPDLQIKNTTPYEVLIWASYTDTSITVSMHSTPYVHGEQSGQTTSPSGKCTLVTTERTRTYQPDNRTEIDYVKALYQPGEGVRCG